MIDAGTIGATLSLDITPFSQALSQSINELYSFDTQTLLCSSVLGALQGQAHDTGLAAYSDLAVPYSMAAGAMAGSCAAMGKDTKELGLLVKREGDLMGTNLLRGLKSVTEQAPAITAALGQGLINGLEAKRPSLMAAAKSIATGVAAAMKKSLGIASPSRVMAQVGRYTAEGLAVGMTEGMPQVEKAAQMLSAAAKVTVENKSEVKSESVYVAAQRQESERDSGIAQRLDRLIELLDGDKRELEIDGRAFASLVRRYC